MSDGFLPPQRDLSDDAYRAVLTALVESGALPGMTVEEAIEQQIPAFGKLRCAMGEAAVVGRIGWPTPNVTYAHKLVSLKGVTTEEADEIYRMAFTLWSQVCGIQPAINPNFDAANIYALSTMMDGRSGTLADSYLPVQVSMTSRLRQRYDDSETWTHNWLLEVALHEIGHALGLDHSTIKGELMYPYSSGGAVTFPTPDDIRRMQRFYGPATGEAPPAAANFDNPSGVIFSSTGISTPFTAGRFTYEDGRNFRVKVGQI
jgi:hypothetical protein